MDFTSRIRGALLASISCCSMLLPAGTSLAVSFSEFVDPHPAPENQFGAQVLPLSTGNVVITSPFDDAGGTDAGAVYLFNGATGALVSILRGSTPGDQIGYGYGTDPAGSGSGIKVLSNGNYVIRSPRWDNGAVVDAGAVTWGSGTTGVSGVVSAANSLVGSTAGDRLSAGSFGVWALSNGNYVVLSTAWDNGAVVDAGAATWCNGSTGVSGVVSAANSLVGSSANDQVGIRATALTNGNYVVCSPGWDNGAVVDVGAVTWGSGTTGVSGMISAANSLVGSMAGDLVGSNEVKALTNGNYVVTSPAWNNGAFAAAGAATWCNGTTGMTGVVSAANSLVGSAAGCRVGMGNVAALTNGNYVVTSPSWDDGAVGNVGAVTWGSGTTGVTGVVSFANSLIGSTFDDQVGNFFVTALTNGNYVVISTAWGPDGVGNAGAVTWGNGTTGVSGVVSADNSLVGSPTGGIGDDVTALANGNYVVHSPFWNGTAPYVGAATWGNGTTGVTGVVSAANSLVGSTFLDGYLSSVTALSNGNYVVANEGWDNGAIVDAGAVTWCSGTSVTSGVVSAANSLVGSTAEDEVGSDGTVVGARAVTALANGNYVVRSFQWDNDGVANVGAVTWGSGTTGITGVISAANSLVGSKADDLVGVGVNALASGDYVVTSWLWDNDAIVDAGAATWGNGTTGVTGTVSAANSLVGTSANTNLQRLVGDDQVNHTFMARFLAEGGGRVRVGSQSQPNVDVADNLAPVQSTIGVRPNPARGNALHVAFALPFKGPARLELLDVSGRRVLAREVGSLGSGQHTVNLAEGRKVAPGIYWVRLTQGAKQQRARVAVIE